MLVHTVDVGCEFFAYDVYSNRIVQLAREERTIVDALARGLREAELLAVLSREHPHLDGRRAIDDFRREALELGAFQAIPRRSVAAEPSTEMIEHQLNHHLRLIGLEVTQRCSLRCKYCVFSGMNGPIRIHGSKSMPLDVAIKAVDFLLGHSDCAEESLSFSFYGGEPLLALRTIKRVVDYVRTVAPPQGFTFHLTTNGIALKDGVVRAFLAANKVSITVSIDGPSFVHDTYRRTPDGKPTHRSVESGLEALLKEYPEYFAEHVGFNAVVPHERCREDIVDYFVNSSFYHRARSSSLRLSSVDVFGDQEVLGEIRALAPEPMASDKALHAAERFVRNRIEDACPRDGLESLRSAMMTRLAHRPIVGIPAHVTPSGYCIPGARKLMVTTEGDLQICEKSAGMITIGSLEDGFDIERAHGILKELYSMWSEDCSQCIAQRFCSICPVQIATSHGSLSRQRFRRECEAAQRRLRFDVEDFIRLCHANQAYFEHLKQTTIS